jgi:predicted transport protein
MPTQLQLRRGNTAQTATFTGAVAEITVDTDKKTVIVHDGTTAGGFALALESAQLDQFAFTKANLAFDRANSAFAQANTAYSTANTKFNSSGGTISGNVIVTGNVTPTTDNVYSLGSVGNRWKDLFVGPGSINIDGIVIGNNGGQIVISGASDFVFQSTTGAPSVSSSVTANIALNAFNQANLAFNQANTSYGSFAQANLAYAQANSGYGVAVSAFAQANLAYNAANTAVSTGQANVGAGLITVTSAYQVNVGAGLIGVTSAYGANVGAARIADVASGQANVGASVITLNNNISNAFNQANLAFNAANNAVDTWVRNQANAAYDAANTAVTTGQANVGAGLITVTGAYQANIGASVITLNNNISNAFNQANLAFTAANNAVDTWVRNQANSAYDRGNSAFSQANLAYTTANAALPKTGGTITGDLTVSGNLLISGNTTSLNVSSLTVTDTLIRLGSDNVTDALDIGFIGHYANTPNNHTGLIRKFTDGKYYLFDNLQTNIEPTNIIDIANTRVATLSANLVTNVITLRGLDPLDYSNTIYSNAQANTGAAVISVTSAYQANTGAAALAGQANVGAGLITVTSAYEANVGAARIDANTANTTLAASIVSGRQADNANLGATIITVTNAYQANVGAGLITVTSAYQANVGSARIDANTANTTLAASIASGRQADNANVGASIITVTSAYQANVGAGLITKVAKGGDVMTGALSTSGALIGASLTSNTVATINTNAVYESTAVTTAAATQFTLDSFSTTAYRSAKYLVQISSGSAYELLELALIHDGTTVYLSQYGNIKTGATLAVFDASISTGTLSVLATPNNAVTTFKTAIVVIPT